MATTMATLHDDGGSYMLALEPRFMYDGAAAATADAATDAGDANGESDTDDAGTLVAAGDQAAFIDNDLTDAEALVEAAKAALTSGGEVATVTEIELEPGENVLTAIADELPDDNSLAALHLFSHGASGEATLGDIQLHADNLADYSAELLAWGDALATDGDILFYGCDVASGEAGQAFIAGVAEATGADVAASTDATGAQNLGGDWDLEYSVGSVEATAIEVGDYPGLLDNIVVVDAGTEAASGAEIDGDAVSIGVTATVDADSYYDGGSITFQITNATANDQLALSATTDMNTDGTINATDAALTDGISVLNGSEVYLGDGSIDDGTAEAEKIGTIDTTYNGMAGGTAYDSANGTLTLKINFEDPTPGSETYLVNSSGTNEGFEDGDTSGWKVFQGADVVASPGASSAEGSEYTISGLYPNTSYEPSLFVNEYFSDTLFNLNGQSVDYKFVNSDVDKGGGAVTGEGTGAVILDFASAGNLSAANIFVETVTGIDGDETNTAVRLNSVGSVTATHEGVADGNYSIHGPYMRSDTFTVEAGDEIKVDWKAEYTQDAYEVFGFLVGSGVDGVFDGDDDGAGGTHSSTDDTRTLLFGQRGDVQDWTTFTGAVSTAGDYQFEFVAGSYDEDGQGGLGATLYIDNVRRTTGTIYEIDAPEIDAIGAVLTYQNTYTGDYDGSTEYSDDNRALTTTLTPQTGTSVTADSTIFINASPDGAERSITMASTGTHAFTSDNFGFSDPDGHDFEAVTILTLPDKGTLAFNGVEVEEGDRIPAANFGQLTFTPGSDAEGGFYTSFTFQVEDSGGGPTNLDPITSDEATAEDSTPDRVEINIEVVPEEEEIILPLEYTLPDPPPTPDVDSVRILDVGETVPIELADATIPEIALGEVGDYDIGDIVGVQEMGITFDHYRSDSGYQVRFPDSIGFDPNGEVTLSSGNEGLLPMGSIQFTPGSDVQSPALKFSALDPDASGEAEVTVEGVDKNNGLRTQHGFKVTVENGTVKSVEYLGASEAAEAESTPGGEATLEGGLSPEDARGSATPQGEAALEGGVTPEEAAAREGEGASLEDGATPPAIEGGVLPEGVLPQEGAMVFPVGGMPLSVFGLSVNSGLSAQGHSLTGQLQQATQGAFAAHQASLLGALYGVGNA
uniref:DUF4347 domain-containing protein n=1 Tax=Candidatus Kentrum eta TaxID=2126337 RepID=A0A450UB93_9GAMM|nr:MAG: protein of unknown function (DUF4347) [Candidatus Kentron sp. H]VFJ90991.1 MAG: protein of unknown function (DUF4347) [Candidatus Kentron sp. H]VFJ97315.1 MAG: protein of unknown function (DUF4347) [Candidatus Kentron sp. H]